MNFQRLITFMFTSAAAGIATAVVVLLFWPGLLPHEEAVLNLNAPVPGNNGWADSVALAEPSVVNIYTSKITRQEGDPLFKNPLMQRYFGDPRGKPKLQRRNNLGSGVVVDANGYILTSNHVIKGADDIFIGAEDQPQVPARVVGIDPDTDLAVIQAAGKDLPPARLGNSAGLRVGDIALAIGNPFGVGKTVTQGIISATGREGLGLATFEDFIQTDAAINMGNSGGALINARGEVIGINTAILSSSGGSHGIGFAIPINLARQVMEQIIRHGRVIRGWIGASGSDLTPAIAKSMGLAEDTTGVLLSGILEDGPADKVGIMPGDIIQRINGKPVKNALEVMNAIAVAPPGTTMDLSILRNNKTMDVQLAVAERPLNVE
ncbi:S1C family serine protease [Thiolapillus brandeum]|uniref:S1C family serine protease n=1 Tax=Thiolapillus brandeum TaxID=1076588 RepID=UPI000AEB1E56|nr:trypsin-like peptidase domain-containing protein [Thiolapillus brandeum]